MRGAREILIKEPYQLGTFVIVICSIFLLVAILFEHLSMEANAAIAPSSDAKTRTPIKHIIVISQGARSFDNYFGTFPGANGIPDNITLPLNPFPPISKDFTVAVWFNTNKTISSKGILLNKGGLGSDVPGKNMNYGLWMTPTARLVEDLKQEMGTDHYISSQGRYNDGKWHQAVIAYDSKSRLRLFMDGNESASSYTMGAIPDTTGVQPIIMGANSLHKDNFFTGFIDEVRIWNRTLGSSEILNGYRNNEFNTDRQFVYLPLNDGEAINKVGFSEKSIQLKGTYFNGSSFQDVKSVYQNTLPI